MLNILLLCGYKAPYDTVQINQDLRNNVYVLIGTIASNIFLFGLQVGAANTLLVVGIRLFTILIDYSVDRFYTGSSQAQTRIPDDVKLAIKVFFCAAAVVMTYVYFGMPGIVSGAISTMSSALVGIPLILWDPFKATCFLNAHELALIRG